ncbi:MarR family winged helix-turn-helix transcriptional regulator [Amycolatopsis sp. TNS106]|uniref:MarR family winged helix-turn-helix transcriptional regulator n=1 Tax=Amycolatopsis sp. TNS106 TaxID=2861750 RepID=UPI001C58613F|nr:MarR family transcriptional regulator [Amycolatopsis sp. TNS106]QXV56947.1 MarR family transcriptional regulator [Amycolatopsis sp. TNS106]
MFELSVLMAGYIEHSLAERGLTRARATVVWELFHRGPMTQRELSQALNVTPRNVTGLLDALQEGGFVDRNPHPTDRRATMVSITAKARRAAKAMNEDHRQFAQRLFAAMPQDDLTLFDATLTGVLAQLREVTDSD